MKWLLAVVVTLVAGLVLAGGGIYLSGWKPWRIMNAEEPYHLGVMLALSGPGAIYSKDGLEAIQLAVEEINDQGGLLGKHPIRLFVRDTGTDSDTAARDAVSLILTNEVRTILGTYSSACAMAIKNACREAKVLHIAAISNSEEITRKDFSPYTYSVVPNSYMQAKAAVLGIAKLAQIKGWREYVTIASDYEWGRSTQQNMTQLLGEVAPELTLKKAFWPSLGASTFAPFVTEILSLKPHFVFGSLGSKDNALWMQEAGGMGLFREIAYPGSMISVSELINRNDTLTRGMVGLSRAPFFAHLNEPMMEHFITVFREKYNRYPSDWAVMEYDAVYALKQGIEKAGNIASENVKDMLRGGTVQTCRGKLKFREIDNQLACSSYMGVVADDPKFPFPIYYDLIEIKGPDSWRPETEIIEARMAEGGISLNP